jgi:hypothetical protein
MVREADRVGGFFCQSRPGKLWRIAAARQRGGMVNFVVASIGIVARGSRTAECDRRPKSCTLTFGSYTAQKDNRH